MSKHKSKKKNQGGSSFIVRLGGEQIDRNRIPQKWVLSVKIDKLPRLSRIHQSISKAANLVMPPIEIVPSGWVTSDNSGMIQGRCALMPYGDLYLFGAQISVATLFFVDDILLRRILVHEFTHCFWHYEQLMLVTVNGDMKVDFNPSQLTEKDVGKMSDNEKDALTRANPFDWFAAQDANQFLGYGEAALDLPTSEFQTNWLDEGLPTEVPDLKIKVHGARGIPDYIIKRIFKLRGEAVVGPNSLFKIPDD